MLGSLKVAAMAFPLMLIAPGSAFAQPFFEDPTPPGFKVVAMFTGLRTVPGVANVIHCTNLGQKTATMRVDFFAFNSANVGTASISLGAGETRSITTVNSAFYGATSASIGNFAGQSAAKVMSDGAKFMCTGDMVGTTGSPPAFFHRLQRFDKSGN